MKTIELVLPSDFDEYAWEVEKKGWFSGATIKFDGQDFHLLFYDLARLSQDIEDGLLAHAVFFEQNLIVLSKVTREAMENAVTFIFNTDKITQLKPVAD